MFRYGVFSFVLLLLLTACGESHEQMIRQLEEQERMNRADSVMQNDSLAEHLVRYFDRHGDSNERMRAHYILGRTYADMGELPRALETYFLAADIADTTLADCDFAKLSRIHAQSAIIFHRQIQPRSEIRELSQASYYAWKAKDTLQAIECYAQQSGAYRYLKLEDSAIYVKEAAAKLYEDIGRVDYSSMTLISIVVPLLEKKQNAKAKHYLENYELQSGLVDENGNVQTGREIFYYIKGQYLLSVNKVDSAEKLFRKELVCGKDLNNQIAGNKGLQDVYKYRGNSDSIAKYATIGYELNDSAYSLSEMQNIQRFLASYNYNHKKLLAEQKEKEAQKAYSLILLILCFMSVTVLIAGVFFFIYRKRKELLLKQYQHDLESLERAQTELLELHSEENQVSEELLKKKNAEILELQSRIIYYMDKVQKHRQETMEKRLLDSSIAKHLLDLTLTNPPLKATLQDFKDLKTLINQEIPSFYNSLNTANHTLRSIEYDVCMLIRLHFQPADICKLTGISDGYASNLRRRLLLRVFGVEGTPKDFDRRIMSIK